MNVGEKFKTSKNSLQDIMDGEPVDNFMKGKAARSVKLDKKRAKVNVTNARAAGIVAKGEARKTLAEKGINVKSEAGQILSDVISAATGKQPNREQLEPTLGATTNEKGLNDNLKDAPAIMPTPEKNNMLLYVLLAAAAIFLLLKFKK